MRPPALRERLVLAASVAVAIALAVVTTAFYFVLQHRLDRDAESTLRSRSDAALATVTVHHGNVGIQESPRDALLDDRVWVFQGTRAVDRPVAPPRVQRAVNELVAAGRPGRRDAEPDTRLLAEPVHAGGRQVGMVVAAVSLAPYEHTARI